MTVQGNMSRGSWALLLALGVGSGGCQTGHEVQGAPLPDAGVGTQTPDNPDVMFPGNPDVMVAGSGGSLSEPRGCVAFGGSAGVAAPGGASIGPSFKPQALFGPTQVAAVPPPPISGGTLLSTRDGKQLVAADPDRDQVYFIDSATFTLQRVEKLNAGDEPGRLVEDAGGRIHVALRSGHGIATLTREPGTPILRREVCALPRGLAYDAAHDTIQVACAEGKLVTLPAASGAATRTLTIGRDARDVIVRGDKLFVTQFRSAQFTSIASDGTLSEPSAPPTFAQTEFQFVPNPDPQACGGGESVPAVVTSTPTVAWRAIDVPGQGVAMLHQRARMAEVQVTQGGYGMGNCGSGIVQTSLTIGMDEGNKASVDLGNAALAVDMAVDSEGLLLAVVATGNAPDSQPVQLYRLTGAGGVVDPVSSKNDAAGGPAGVPSLPADPSGSNRCLVPERNTDQPEGQATAVAFASAYMLAVQEREPAAISFIDTRTGMRRARLDLQQPSRFDTGHAMFHMRAGAGIACASCHPEGGDDSHVWSFHGIGARRTQNLRGGILGTEPFHWNGDMQDFPTLVREVFVGRMSGFEPQQDQTSALSHWIDKQPELQSGAQDVAATERGKALFQSAAVGCVSCHSGALLTNNESADVGTGAKLQVPALRGVSFRGPWMHDGCAKTLLDRFGTCGGGDMHGKTSQLTTAQLGDLVSYLETL